MSKKPNSCILRFLARRLIPYIKEEQAFLDVTPPGVSGGFYGYWFSDKEVQVSREEVVKVVASLRHYLDDIEKICRQFRNEECRLKQEVAAKLSKEELQATNLEGYVKTDEETD